MSRQAEAPAWVRPTVDYGPLAAFFVTYLAFGFMAAVAVIVVATLLALALSLALARRVPVMSVVAGVLVAGFGGLSLLTGDQTFYKMKPTIVQALMAAVLLGGLAVNRPLLKPVLGAAWRMDGEGWRRLSFRFGVFFAVMAVLNEIVWRTQSTDFWVGFKVFGILVLTFGFVLSQMPLMNRHQLPEPEEEGRGGL